MRTGTRPIRMFDIDGFRVPATCSLGDREKRRPVAGPYAAAAGPPVKAIDACEGTLARLDFGRHPPVRVPQDVFAL